MFIISAVNIKEINIFRVIETLVEVWENKKCGRNTGHRQVESYKSVSLEVKNKHVIEFSYKIPADCMTVCQIFWG